MMRVEDASRKMTKIALEYSERIAEIKRVRIAVWVNRTYKRRHPGAGGSTVLSVGRARQGFTPLHMLERMVRTMGGNLDLILDGAVEEAIEEILREDKR